MGEAVGVPILRLMNSGPAQLGSHAEGQRDNGMLYTATDHSTIGNTTAVVTAMLKSFVT